MLCEALYFTDLTFRLIYLQKVSGLRDVSSCIYILKGPFLPVSKSSKWQDFSSTSNYFTEWEVYCQVNYEYHGFFHPLETGVASAHCFPHPNVILCMAFEVYPLLCQYVWRLYQFVNTQSQSPPCMTLSLSQLTYNCTNETLLICLKITFISTIF